MGWEPGARIGTYEITAILGAGGMGEVYRARDVRLARDVALKVLPQALVHDPERRARFEREARVLASLSHPNIAAIHGIEDAAGSTTVLVLEFVEGQTLADRIASGPIPLDETTAIALQIAEGLEAAHDRGIVHRDLKPANVQVSRDGTVKVLDFGLAKALDSTSSTPLSGDPLSPTITSASTQLGVILGTAAYMAPEQARGRSVDRRADIWAFGALVFEMLSGARAFPGETISDTIAAILGGTPDWSRLPKGTPAWIRALIERCLERDPRQRLQSIGEARIALSRPAQAVAVEAPSRKGVPIAVAAALAVAAAASAGGLTWWISRSDDVNETAAVRKFDLAIDGLLVSPDRPPILSPDGSRIAYYAAGKLWIRSTADFTAKEVPASGNGLYPTWSTDGRQLAFVQGKKLYRVSVDGGEPQLVGAVPDDMTGSGAAVWRADGSFVVVGSDREGITEISGRDGTSREILPLDRKTESDFHELSLLPDGSSVLFTAHTNQGADTIGVLANGTRKDLLKIAGDNLRSPAYHPAGYLLFARETIQRGVWAVRFSLAALETQGDPFLVDQAGRYPSVAMDGTVALVRSSSLPSELVWIDRTGSVRPAGVASGRVPEYSGIPTMRLSPDGRRVAFVLEDELWSFDLERGVASPLTRGVQRVVWPTWLPGGDRVLFAGFAGSRAWSIQSVSATETSTPQRVLPPNDEFQFPCDVSSDGTWLIYGQGFSGVSDLWITPLARPAEAKRLMETPSNEREAKFSPDGRWIAYLSDESGRAELYLRRFPIGNDREMLSSGGASFIQWSRNGREIFYRSGTAIMAVRLDQKGEQLAPSPAVRLFVTSDPAVSQSFVAAPDGQRFLFPRATGSDRIGVILNWAASMAR